MLSTYKRSSVADLRVLYFNQMQTLHASIEGTSKFVPTTLGRHVVSEVEGILSLNSATYKVTSKVKFVILDDAVLVAKRRRLNTGPGEGSGSRIHGQRRQAGGGEILGSEWDVGFGYKGFCWCVSWSIAAARFLTSFESSHDQCIQNPTRKRNPRLPNRYPSREEEYIVAI